MQKNIKSELEKKLSTVEKTIALAAAKREDIK
jgi:hypothetical protein